jgi:hypothetical protein
MVGNPSLNLTNPRHGGSSIVRRELDLDLITIEDTSLVNYREGPTNEQFLTLFDDSKVGVFP